MSTKKSNKSAVVKSAIPVIIPTASETLTECIGRITKSISVMESRKNTLQHALNTSMVYVKAISERDNLEMTAWKAYHESGLSMSYMDMTRLQAININTAMLTLTDTLPDRPRALTVNISSKGKHTLSVTDNDSMVKIDKELIVNSIVTYTCSFAKMPVTQQMLFNESTRNRFNSIWGYVNQWITNGQNKSGFFAECIRQQRTDDLDSPIQCKDASGNAMHNVDGSPVLIIAPDKTTKSRFLEATAIVNMIQR